MHKSYSKEIKGEYLYRVPIYYPSPVSALCLFELVKHFLPTKHYHVNEHLLYKSGKITKEPKSLPTLICCFEVPK